MGPRNLSSAAVGAASRKARGLIEALRARGSAPAVPADHVRGRPRFERSFEASGSPGFTRDAAGSNCKRKGKALKLPAAASTPAPLAAALPARVPGPEFGRPTGRSTTASTSSAGAVDARLHPPADGAVAASSRRWPADPWPVRARVADACSAASCGSLAMVVAINGPMVVEQSGLYRDGAPRCRCSLPRSCCSGSAWSRWCLTCRHPPTPLELQPSWLRWWDPSGGWLRGSSGVA